MNPSTNADTILIDVYSETYPEQLAKGANCDQMLQELDSLARVELWNRLQNISSEVSLQKVLTLNEWSSLFKQEEVTRNNIAPSHNLDEEEIEYDSPSYLYSIWSYFIFCFLSVFATCILLVPISQASSRYVVHIAAKSMFLLLGVKIDLKGEIPNQQLIAVSNHESYLDSLLLYAVLPPRFVFIAKAELKKYFPLGFFLSRIGTFFVDRSNFVSVIQHTNIIQGTIRNEGVSLHVFPEGTFLKKPGLLPFKHGAFYLSAKEKIPILPVKIIGARKALPPGSWLPRYRDIIIRIGSPISPPSDSWRDIVKLRKELFSWLSHRSE